jgi:hypothetical protein
MFKARNYLRGVAAAVALGTLSAGCESVLDMDVGIPGKETLIGKPAPEPNLQEHAPLVIPPPSAALPLPGQGTPVAAQQNPQWPTDPDQAKRQAAKDAAAKQEGNCQNGDESCRPSWFSRMLQ